MEPNLKRKSRTYGVVVTMATRCRPKSKVHGTDFSESIYGTVARPTRFVHSLVWASMVSGLESSSRWKGFRALADVSLSFRAQLSGFPTLFFFFPPLLPIRFLPATKRNKQGLCFCPILPESPPPSPLPSAWPNPAVLGSCFGRRERSSQYGLQRLVFFFWETLPVDDAWYRVIVYRVSLT